MPDLEARARVFVDAMAQLDQGVMLAFLAPDAEVEYPGVLGPLTREAFEALLRTLRANLEAMRVQEMEYRAERVVMQGDTTAVEWAGTSQRNGEAGSYRGATFITWSPEGRVLRAAIYADPAMVRKYSVGWMSQAQA